MHQAHRSRQDAERTRSWDSFLNNLAEPLPEVSEVDPESRLRIEEALAGLPEEERLVVEAFAFGGMSTREIAESLGFAMGTVQVLRRRAFRRLREKLSNKTSGEAAP
ncbi:MAG: sigma-70 family RNA polymerase sigma factor [Actinomycetota bacterium]|nr:sigma-70 family RNA polymerase sigma factor [Actinomycetota bacterium]